MPLLGNAHYDTANEILTETKRLLDVNQAKSVILVSVLRSSTLTKG